MAIFDILAATRPRSGSGMKLQEIVSDHLAQGNGVRYLHPRSRCRPWQPDDCRRQRLLGGSRPQRDNGSGRQTHSPRCTTASMHPKSGMPDAKLKVPSTGSMTKARSADASPSTGRDSPKRLPRRQSWRQESFAPIPKQSGFQQPCPLPSPHHAVTLSLPARPLPEV